ncbi:molybdenum cofactor biosynthesis protein [Gorillibacterium sp. sgz5001074]|uniref:molybdenum cofactor biosynthesis protein n=1 Tax=Gorillibacterium sp. sgz5001074 TaxID=3446695 RepID=UPI003F66BF7C
MKVTIRVFAGLADKLGGSAVELDTDAETLTAGELKMLLSERYPEAAGTIRISFVAKNQAYAKPEELIREGDELALIPPVSGGSGLTSQEQTDRMPDAPILYELTRDVIDAGAVSAKVADPNHGAALAFIGTTREFTQGQRTLTLDYDAYEPMALATMAQIGDEIGLKWPGTRCAITHRLGRVAVGETSVVIAVSSPHRAECYEASRYAIERLKQVVPIWKKELWEDGSEWKGHQLGPWDPTAPAAEGGIPG